MTRSRRPARLALLLSAVLAFTALATPASAAPVDDPCTYTGDFNIESPAVYGFVGVPLAPAPFTTDAAQPVTWSTECSELPSGVTFDQAGATLTGAPAEAWDGSSLIAASDGTGTALSEFRIEVRPASALTAALTDATGTPLDASALQRGTAFQLRGEGLPDSTQVRALMGGVEFGSASIDTGEGEYTIAGVIGDRAASGDPNITVEFTMPGGAQRYTSRVAASVRVFSISGPTALTPVAGTAAEYAFPASGATGRVSYSLSGPLPTGLTFDSARGIIRGTAAPVVFQRNLRITATDALGSVTHAFTLAVLNASVVTPTIASYLTPGVGSSFGQLLNQGLTPEQALERATQQNRPSPGSQLIVVTDPQSGAPSFASSLADIPANLPEGWRLQDQPSISPEIVVGTRDAAALKELAAAEKAAAVERMRADMAAREAANQAAVERARAKAAERAGILAAQRGDAAEQAKAQQERDRAQQMEQAAREREQLAQGVEALLNRVEEAAARAAAARQAQLDRDGESEPLPEGTQVRVEMHSTPMLLGTATVGATGGFALAVAPPAHLTPGLHHLVVTYTMPDGTVHTNRTPVTVLPASALLPAEGVGEELPAGILPVTGTDAASLTAIASLTFLLLGAGLMLLGRRREAAPELT